MYDVVFNKFKSSSIFGFRNINSYFSEISELSHRRVPDSRRRDWAWYNKIVYSVHDILPV